MKKIAIIFAIMACCVAVNAQQLKKIDAADGFAEKLAALSARIETITCSFVQTKHMSVIAGDVVSPGKFYYRRPGNICLEFLEPAGDMIVMDGRRFKIVAMGKKNVVDMESNPMLRQMTAVLEACMTGDVEKMGADSSIEYFEGADIYEVVIVPKNRRAKNYIKAITLTFDKKDMSLSRLRMDEHSGDYTEYRFSDKRFNTAVDSSKFAM